MRRRSRRRGRRRGHDAYADVASRVARAVGDGDDTATLRDVVRECGAACDGLGAATFEGGAPGEVVGIAIVVASPTFAFPTLHPTLNPMFLPTPESTASPRVGDGRAIAWRIGDDPRQTVAVGETVTFNWKGTHNVYLHPTGTCDATGGSEVGGDNLAYF